MNIQPLNYNFIRKQHCKSDYEHAKQPMNAKKSGVCVCVKNASDKITFSGSQEQSVAAANTLMGKILKSSAFNWLSYFSGAHNIASSALISLFLAGLLRPAATVALPGKSDKDDKIYAAGHSMASAVMGFVFSTIVTSPLDSGSKFMIDDGKKMNKSDFAKMSEGEIRDYLRTEFYMSDEEIEKCIKENKAESKITRKFDKGIKIITEKTDKINELKRKLKSGIQDSEKTAIKKQIRDLESHIGAIDTTMKNVVDWGIAIPRAALTIALIPPILKYVFRLEKGKKAEAKPEVKPEVAPQAEKTPEQANVSAVQPQPQVQTPSPANEQANMAQFMQKVAKNGGLK